jgi:hypothetical protein
MAKRKKQPDPSEIARHVLDAVVPDAEPKRKSRRLPFRVAASIVDDDSAPPPAKNPAAVALGRLGGKKGGPARAKKLTDAEKTRIAKKAAAARWSKKQ